MTELFYPAGRHAPLIKGAKASRAAEMLPVIDPDGQVIGQVNRSFCHSSETRPLHPVVHLYILGRDGRFFLQQRGFSKNLFPGKWDFAVGGHVSYGEYLEETLFREAEEELCLHDFSPAFLESYRFDSPTESELVAVYAVVGSFEMSPVEPELAGGRWWTAEEIESNLGHSVFTPYFEYEFPRLKERILSLL
ncbi:MAG: NUDIX domain-containing protein [Bacteroidales bacterium]|nr:NUDIX domain-containing protein [Bacteroidales bacterium]